MIDRRQLLTSIPLISFISPLNALAQAPMNVVASFSILADMAREILPPAINVTSLVGPDSDAHVFDPTPADARRLAGAQVVVVNGLAFEGWINRLIKVAGYKGPLVVATEGVSPRHAGPHREDQHSSHGHGHDQKELAPDPHAWQDLRLAKRYVGNLTQAFSRQWPSYAKEIGRRGADYSRGIDQLDQQIRRDFSRIPRAQRRVISAHDAFGYFAAAYGVDFLAPQGWNTDSEPSAAAIARLIRQIRHDKVKAIFLENITNPRLIKQLAAEGNVKLGGTLYSDALSLSGGPASTYLRMFQHNANTILTALSQS
jgi:zinc/manganese transport system substrate-binding protein